jgi:hypothetical protein
MEAIKGLEEWDAHRPLVQRCREIALSAIMPELKSAGDLLDAGSR